MQNIDYNLSLFISQHFYTLTERTMILVRSLQRSEGDVSDPIKYIYSTSRSSHIRLSVRFYANSSLSFEAIGLKLSQKSYFFCRWYINRNQPDRTTICYSSHRNNRKKMFKNYFFDVVYHINSYAWK